MAQRRTLVVLLAGWSALAPGEVAEAGGQDRSWLSGSTREEEGSVSAPELVPLASEREARAFLEEVRGGSWEPTYVSRVGSLPPPVPEAPPEWRGAIQRLADASESDDGTAAHFLGFLLETGTVLEQDVPAALAWLELAQEAGSAQAAYDRAGLHLAGAVPEGSDRVAALALRAAALRGHPVAQDQLAMRYRTATGTRENREAALRWFRAAAEEGYPPSQFELGMLLLEEEETFQEGRRWLEVAADAGHAQALAGWLETQPAEGPAEPGPGRLAALLARGEEELLRRYRAWLRLEEPVSEAVRVGFPHARFSFDVAGDLAWYRQRLRELGAR